MQNVFQNLNLKKAWVVYNLNGYDELTTTSKNLFIEVKNGKVSKKSFRSR